MKEMHGGDVYRNQVQVDFSVNINPFGMPDEVKEALQDAIYHCTKYPDSQAQELKSRVSEMLQVPQDFLLFGNGASELFMAVVHALHPTNILIPVPSFYGYEYVANAVDGNIHFYKMKKQDDFSLTEDFLDALTEDIQLIFLANPNNPTGKKIKSGQLHKILEKCEKKNIYVLLDECFMEFCEKDDSEVTNLQAYDHLMVVRAFTKIYGIPGVRLGYLICKNESLVKKIEKNLPEWNLSVFAQRAGVACTMQNEFVQKTKTYVAKERQLLAEGLTNLGVKVYPSEANFLLCYKEQEKGQKSLYEMLLEKGILIRNCSNIRGLSAEYFRVAVKLHEENEQLLQTLKECLEKDGKVPKWTE